MDRPSNRALKEYLGQTHDPDGVRLNRVSRIGKRSEGRVGPFVNIEGRMPIGWILIIAGLVGLLIGWFSAPFGLVPT